MKDRNRRTQIASSDMGRVNPLTTSTLQAWAAVAIATTPRNACLTQIKPTRNKLTEFLALVTLIL